MSEENTRVDHVEIYFAFISLVKESSVEKKGRMRVKDANWYHQLSYDNSCMFISQGMSLITESQNIRYIIFYPVVSPLRIHVQLCQLC